MPLHATPNSIDMKTRLCIAILAGCIGGCADKSTKSNPSEVPPTTIAASVMIEKEHTHYHVHTPDVSHGHEHAESDKERHAHDHEHTPTDKED